MTAAELVAAASSMPAVTVLGGCCGTDVRHIDAIGAVLRASPPS
jgi:methionine synthase I (cobalamin-dependent)